jgi:hypothetical protein
LKSIATAYEILLGFNHAFDTRSYQTIKPIALEVFGKMVKPTPSDTIPKYVAEGIARQDTDTLHAIIQYCERLIDHYNQEVDESELAGENEEVVDVEETEGGAVVIKKVPCGKESCSTCPHGPYKYLVTREGESLNWEYKGATEQ